MKAVAFDLDGTLVDSRKDLAAAVNRARGDFGLPPLPLAEIVGMVGEGAVNLVAKAMVRELGAARLPEALARFFEHYGRGLLDATRPYPGVEAMLGELAGRFPLALLTNKPEGFSRHILEGLGLAGRFREILGGDTLPRRKPDPAGLREAARRLGVAAAELLLVGDSAIDAATARAAGSPFALVAWGFAGEAERTELARGADLVVAQPAELLQALLFKGR